MRRMIETLFPSYVYHKSILNSRMKNLNQDLVKESQKIREIDDQGQKWSQKNYLGGYTSYGSMSELHLFSSSFDELRKKIDKEIAHFVQHLEMDISPKELKMRNCWINIMNQHVTHSMHIHPLSVISGTYYLKIPKGSSGLKFEDPRLNSFMASPPRKTKAQRHNQRFVTLQPQVGDVILFESWMRHEVTPQPKEAERISISFNYDWLP